MSTFLTKLYTVRKRLNEKELEKCINLLEDERKRRSLYRSDEVVKTTKLKGV